MVNTNKVIATFLLIVLGCFVFNVRGLAEIQEVGGSANVDGQITFFESDETKQTSPSGTKDTSGDKKNYLPQTGDNLDFSTRVTGLLLVVIVGMAIMIKERRGYGCDD